MKTSDGIVLGATVVGMLAACALALVAPEGLAWQDMSPDGKWLWRGGGNRALLRAGGALPSRYRLAFDLHEPKHKGGA